MGVDRAALFAKAQTGAYDSGSSSGSDSSSEYTNQAGSDSSTESSQTTTTDTSFGTVSQGATSTGGDRQRGSDGKFQSQSASPPPAPGSGPSTTPAAKPKAGPLDEGDIDPDNKDTWKPSHRIDYERFRKVISQRDTHARESAALKSKIAELEQALKVRDYIAPSSQQQTKANSAQNVIDDIWGEQNENPWQQPFQQMQTRLDQLENERRVAEFDRETKAVLAKYPDVDETLFYQAVAANIGDTAFDLEDVAEQLQAQLDGYATRRYGSRQSAPTPAQTAVAAPPRPAPIGSSIPQNQTSRTGVDMSDPDQRQARLLELVKQRFG